MISRMRVSSIGGWAPEPGSAGLLRWVAGVDTDFLGNEAIFNAKTSFYD
jgi:hypothetical protein